MCVREVLHACRVAQPDSEVTCIAFHTLDSGQEVTRMGPAPSFPSRLPPKDVLVLSVTVTETTFESVHTVTHVLVVRKQQRPPPARGPRLRHGPEYSGCRGDLDR